MAYTVTYKRRTQTGKVSTVKRRVEGNRPTPSSPSPGTSVPRAKKPAARNGQITSAKRPSASKQFKAPAPQKKSSTVKRGSGKKSVLSSALGAVDRFNPVSGNARALGGAIEISGARVKGVLDKKAAEAASVARGIAAQRRRDQAAKRRQEFVTNRNVAYSNSSLLMQAERALRSITATEISPREAKLRAIATRKGQRLSNVEQALAMARIFEDNATIRRNRSSKDMNKPVSRKQYVQGAFIGMVQKKNLGNDLF